MAVQRRKRESREIEDAEIVPVKETYLDFLLARISNAMPTPAPAAIPAPDPDSIVPLVPYAPPAAFAVQPARKTADPGPPSLPTPAFEWLLLSLSLALLFAIVLPPLINLGPYQRRIINNLSRSLGREVTMRTLTLRLLPLPALVMTDLIVHEGQGFGEEPALRAPSANAQLRLASLLHWRLEIGRVEMSDASLNLVRDANGRWNVGAILLQASHVANAPTGQKRAGPAPRFPYIEITDSRINVKQGVEKLPYALLNTNLSMWLAEPDMWQIKLDGQPVRTDIQLGLSDTGVLRMEGQLHRASALGDMPLALHGEWSNAPLGQASRLLLGGDPGWRGDLHAIADVAGDLDNLAIKTHVLIANLHRQEFTPPEPFTVDATCRAAYSRAAHTLSGISCHWPVGTGEVLLGGSLAAGGPANHGDQGSHLESTLALTVQELPANFLVAAAGLTRSDFAPAFHLEGSLNGMLFYNAHGGNAPLYAGVLEAPRLMLVAAGLERPLELDNARLAAATPSPSGTSMLVMTTAPLDLGGVVPALISAQLTTQGFVLHASGSASVARLEELGRATHLLPPALAWLAPDGLAEFDVNRSAGWQPEETAAPAPAGPNPPAMHSRESRSPTYATAAVTDGWLKLFSAKYAPRFLAEAVSLPSAEAKFLPGEIAWNLPLVAYHGLSFQLGANYSLDCAGHPGCVTHFHATCGTLDGEALVTALTGADTDQHLLDQLLKRVEKETARWPAMQGTVHADTLTLGPLALRNSNATLSIADGQVSIGSLDAQALGGALHGEGAVTMGAGEPHYQLSTVLTRASASSAGSLFHENWGGGTLTVSSKLQLAGLSATQLAESATGQFHAEWLHGSLGNQTPLAQFTSWTADGNVANQAFALTQGQLSSGLSSGVLPVSGSITFDRTLALHIGAVDGTSPGANASATVTGTLSRPAK